MEWALRLAECLIQVHWLSSQLLSETVQYDSVIHQSIIFQLKKKKKTTTGWHCQVLLIAWDVACLCSLDDSYKMCWPWENTSTGICICGTGSTITKGFCAFKGIWIFTTWAYKEWDFVLRTPFPLSPCTAAFPSVILIPNNYSWFCIINSECFLSWNFSCQISPLCLN